ncbi:unnamed protein product [Brassicogethes aeneus]|uniref:DNA-binding protein D-ETS-4 n=1 Tax=Brassicogethes aeneus TaxID=1431903 RepID=A0A9P0B8X0_BRAAE|nr:unnamed protein product [Brassicogethes aeneus]
MVLLIRNTHMDDTMPQMVPSAGFTPPCDYSNFAENFDLSLLPGSEFVTPPFYSQSVNVVKQEQPKIYTSFHGDKDLVFAEEPGKVQNIYLEVSSPAGSLSPYSPHSQGLLSPNDNFTAYRQSEINYYPSSPELSLYTPSPNSIYSRSPCGDYGGTSPLPSFSPFQIKEENYLSPCNFSSPTSPVGNYTDLSSPDLKQESTDVVLLENNVMEKQIKQESTVDFSNILQSYNETDTFRQLIEEDLKKQEHQIVPEKPKDHQLLREVLKDTSFQKKYNLKPFDFGFIGDDIKMEDSDECEGDLIKCKERIEPVLNIAIEQIRKDVDRTCAALGITPDPCNWTSADVFSWIKSTSRQFHLPEPTPEQWDVTGSTLMSFSDGDFTRRAPQSGSILHAQLEIWKAAYSDDNNLKWTPDGVSSNASSGDISDEEEEDSSPPKADASKPTTSRAGGSHIHLWQFLRELLASPQVHGSCIRWLDRSKGIFKIEDSVKVARLWGKRKNRPAMNYDKLSRSIRQYYKKGIMKKTERSQRLVYQFCHPYNLSP